jgi:hypothetical protein
MPESPLCDQLHSVTWAWGPTERIASSSLNILLKGAGRLSRDLMKYTPTMTTIANNMNAYIDTLIVVATSSFNVAASTAEKQCETDTDARLVRKLSHPCCSSIAGHTNKKAPPKRGLLRREFDYCLRLRREKLSPARPRSANAARPSAPSGAEALYLIVFSPRQFLGQISCRDSSSRCLANASPHRGYACSSEDRSCKSGRATTAASRDA